jgi:integrase
MKRGEVVALLDAIVDAGKPFAANRCFAAVRRMFNWAVERSYLEVSPCYGVKAPTDEGEGRSRVLDASELTAILQVAKETPFPFGPYLILLLATATRRNELAQVRRSEIDLERKVLLVPADRSKNKIARSVPLSRFALSVIETLPNFEDGRLFPSGNPEAVDRGISGFGKMTARFRTKCKIENWRLHDLRRSAASHMQSFGANVETIKVILGHKAVGGVTGIYARHAYSAESVDALERWGEFLANRLTPKPAKVIPIRKDSRRR